MTGRERIDRTLRGETVDHLARVPILMRYAAEHIGSDYAAFASDHRVLARANLACARDFGFDQLSAISDPYRETQGYGAVIRYVTDGVPRCLNHPLADTRNLDELPRPDPLVAVRMKDRVDGVRLMAAAGTGASVLGWIEGPAAEAADLRGTEAFLVDLLDDEDFAGELMDRVVDDAVRFARAQVDAGCDMVGIGDAIASQVGPDLYERLIQPREKRLVQAIKAMGATVRMHICGNIAPLIDGLADVRPDVLDVDHMVPLAAVRKVFPTTALAGNLDPAEDVLRSTPARIREAVRRRYHEAGNPFLVAAGCEIPSGTPPENLAALCETVQYVN